MARLTLPALLLAGVCGFTGCAGHEVARSVSPDGRCRVTVRQWSSNPFSLDPGVWIEGRCGWRRHEILKMDDWPVNRGEFAWARDSRRVGIAICAFKPLGFDFDRGRRDDQAPEVKLAAERLLTHGGVRRQPRDCW
jgi:hypothetical protein